MWSFTRLRRLPTRAFSDVLDIDAYPNKYIFAKKLLIFICNNIIHENGL